MAVIEQTKRDVGNLRVTLDLIDLGIYRPHRDGIDITEETRAETQRRLALGLTFLATV